MDRRTNCYLNSAYNRNIDDFDDYIDTESQLSFDSKGQSYESENETYVDDFLDDYTICYEDNRIPTIEPRVNRSFVNPMQKSRYESACGDSFVETSSSKLDRSRLTSTPKKQIKPQAICSPSGRKLPHRRNTLVRSRSISIPGRSMESGFVENNHLTSNMRRSKSSLSLCKQRLEDQRPREQRNIAKSSSAGSDYQYHAVTRSKSFHNFTEPALHRNIRSVSPFQIRERDADAFSSRRSNQSFLRRPYDSNSSFSSSRPLMSQRNTAIISPIYKKTAPYSFELDSTLRNAFTIAADRSTSSSCKSSWVQVKKQTIPLCTLRTSAIMLLISGTLSCLFCLHIISMRGKSYELSFSLLSGFVALLLGFPCLRFQEWQWLPNRNYVSGYVVLSLFSLMQTSALWVMDEFPDLEPEFVDLIRGVLYALSGLSLGIALLGICTSCCCKYPPPDNRVTHGVQGFTV